MNRKESYAKNFEKQFKKELKLIKSFLFDIAMNRHNIGIGFSEYFDAYVCALEEEDVLKALFTISFMYKDINNENKIINPWDYQFLPKELKERCQIAIRLKTKNIFHDRIFNDFNTVIDFAKKNL